MLGGKFFVRTSSDNLRVHQLMRPQALKALCSALMATLLLLSGGCYVTLVQPYDEKLLTETEAIFKKASAMIDDGIAASPTTDENRSSIKKPEDHPAHISKFDERYRSLSTDADALVLRALAKSQDVSPVGDKLQKKISDLIEQALPSQCEDLEGEPGVSTSSLTVKNYIDLKCILVRWEAQHADVKLTQGTQILKRTNWELRKTTIFGAILAIQKAETSKGH